MLGYFICCCNYATNTHNHRLSVIPAQLSFCSNKPECVQPLFLQLATAFLPIIDHRPDIGSYRKANKIKQLLNELGHTVAVQVHGTHYPNKQIGDRKRQTRLLKLFFVYYIDI